MNEEPFVATRQLTWNGEQFDVAMAPSTSFVAKGDHEGCGLVLTPAYTREEWEINCTARWTTDRRGNWYRSGRLVQPVVVAVSDLIN